MHTESIAEMVVPIEGYDELKRRLLRGELERFRRSLEWIEARPGGSLLDLGACGDLVPVYRGELGYERVVCLDAAGKEGHRRLQHSSGAVYDFEAHRLSLEHDPYPLGDGEFDQVVAMEVLEHLAVDPMFMLAEANRVVKPGGTLLLTTPNINSLASLYLQLWGRHPAIGGQTFGPGIMDRHHREYTPDEISQVLRAAGFKIEGLETFDVQPPNASVRQVYHLLIGLRCLKRDIDVDARGAVIRCACVKVSDVIERFPEVIYPRYPYYDYTAYDRELTKRFGGRRYWQTNVATAGGRPAAAQTGTPATPTHR